MTAKNMIDLHICCDEYDFSPLKEAFSKEAEADVPLSAEIVICGEEEIKELNARFRKTDRVTDVLSFPSLDGILGREIKAEDFPYDIDEEGRLSIGSVVICKAVAQRQAEEYGHSFERELNYLAVHGLLHLLGYDHIEESDRVKMRAEEEKVLKILNLSRD